LLEKVSPDIAALAATSRAVAEAHGDDVLRGVLTLILDSIAPTQGDEP
jgi:hypothetical protein